jgi:cytoskeletal protein CcmA (bactofilin family)
VADAVIKGRFLGKLNAQHSLEIHRTAEIKGSFTTGNLIIPPGGLFRWPEALRIGGADIAGELIADVKSTGKVVLRSAARLFGNIQAAALEVEDGAILVGSIRVGLDPEPEPAPAPAPPQAAAPAAPPAAAAPKPANSRPAVPRPAARRVTPTRPRVARDSSP